MPGLARVACSLALLATLGGLVIAPPAVAQQRRILGGDISAAFTTEYSEGRYGDAVDTEIWDWVFSARYTFEELGLTKWDEIELRASIPLRRITEPSNSFTRDRKTESGIGDLALRVGYFWVPESLKLPTVGFLVGVELPTAQNDLGSDETDVIFALDLEQPIRFGKSRYPRLTPWVRARYRVNGTEDKRLREDTYSASTGFVFRPLREVGFGLEYDWSEDSGGGSDRHLLIPFVSLRATDWLRITPYGLAGISGQTVDRGAGLTLRIIRPVD